MEEEEEEGQTLESNVPEHGISIFSIYQFDCSFILHSFVLSFFLTPSYLFPFVHSFS